MNIIEELERKLERLMKQPKNSYLYNHIGVYLYQLKDFKNGEMYFQRAYELNPIDKDILYNYILILYQQYKFEKVISIYENHLNYIKVDKEIMRRIADCYYQLGNYELASKIYKECQKV